jgi:multimeric flavodoxin WrbA
MHAVVLSAAPPDSGALLSTVQSGLARAGYEVVTTFDVSSTKLAFCQGEFDCWVKTPGVCRVHDAETAILQAVHDADALVLLGPVTFGGHGSVLKLAVDRLIPIMAPFFTKRHALTHHLPRYARYPALFSVGWLPHASASLATTFAELNDANAINLLAPARGAVVLDDAHEGAWAGDIRRMLESPRTPGEGVIARAPLRAALLEAAAPDPRGASASRTRRAALLVGSAKIKGTSASETMARALAERLSALRVPTELHFATELVHDDAHTARTARTIAACDLFVLVTPLYVDSLPALATHALELVDRERAANREDGAPPSHARFAAIVNCGFPEAEQTRTAMRIARHFAAHAGYAWAGGLPLGAGGVVKPGVPLEDAGAPVRHVVRALDLAAPALARGGVVPYDAIYAMASSPMPDALYRFVGDIGWHVQARRNGIAQRDLHARPHDTR